MAIIPQRSLFSWEIVDASPDIQRIVGVLESIPDEDLMLALETQRQGRRNRYPLRPLWNSFLTGILCGHPGPAALIAELKRNAELRQVCGFAPELGADAVPPDYVYSRLFTLLIKHLDKVGAIFDALVDRVAALLPDYGRHLALDSKALPTFAKTDANADQGFKTYEGLSEEGTPEKRIVSWFGYKLHLLVDSVYELPVAFHLTQASESDVNHLIPLIDELSEKHPIVHDRAEDITGDRGYDDGEDKRTLYEDHDILPIIPARDLHAQEDAGYRPLNPRLHDTIYINDHGDVACKINPFAAKPEQRFLSMQHVGYEADRRTHKFRCPAKAFGVDCHNRGACRCAVNPEDPEVWGRTLRIHLDLDRRVFMPVHATSRDFEKRYNRRTSVERVNSRIDNVYGFERRSIRGLKKMELRIGLSMIIMLASAAWWIEQGQVENIRRLLTAA
jgi:hypothetical protein